MKKVFFILILALSPICWADNYVFMKAQRDLNQSLIAFNKKDTECRESAITLPATIFSNININAEEKKVALRYYHAKSLFECTQEEIKNYLLASATIAALADEERARSVCESNLLFIDIKLHWLKAEADYQKLDDSLKASLNQIELLQQPFKLIESAIALGL